MGIRARDGLRLYTYGDEELFYFLKNRAKEDENNDLLRILSDINNRRLYKRAFMTDKRHHERTTEDAKEKNLGILRDEIARKAELDIEEIYDIILHRNTLSEYPRAIHINEERESAVLYSIVIMAKRRFDYLQSSHQKIRWFEKSFPE